MSGLLSIEQSPSGAPPRAIPLIRGQTDRLPGAGFAPVPESAAPSTVQPSSYRPLPPRTAAEQLVGDMQTEHLLLRDRHWRGRPLGACHNTLQKLLYAVRLSAAVTRKGWRRATVLQDELNRDDAFISFSMKNHPNEYLAKWTFTKLKLPEQPHRCRQCPSAVPCDHVSSQTTGSLRSLSHTLRFALPALRNNAALPSVCFNQNCLCANSTTLPVLGPHWPSPPATPACSVSQTRGCQTACPPRRNEARL